MAKKTKEVNIASDDLKELLEGDDIVEVNEFVPTGSTLLDYAIANRKNGGIPVGRITELIGENQAGKTLIATHVLANTQKAGGIAIFIDTEHDADKGFCVRIGANWDALIYKEWLSSLEEVFGYIENVIIKTRLKHKDKLITIVWDSVGATPAAVELESGYDPTKLVGIHARIMSMGLRKLRPAIKSERIAMLFTNQLRSKIGGMTFGGDSTTTSHGKAMSFYASVRIKLARVQQLKDKEGRIVGAYSEAKIIKNKVGPAWRTVTLPIMYDFGIDDAGSLFDYLTESKEITGVQTKTIVANGQEYKFKNQDWGKLLKDTPDLKKYVFDLVDKKMTIPFDRNLEDAKVDIDSILDEDLKEKLTNLIVED
jgi:recombination protein RecA